MCHGKQVPVIQNDMFLINRLLEKQNKNGCQVFPAILNRIFVCNGTI